MDVASVTQAIVTAVVATAVPTATATDPASAAPLSRPKSHHEKHIASIVILITAALSVTGALWMIMGFLLNKNLRTFRHQLILGLAISDFFMALNFLSSAASNLAGHDIGTPEMTRFCSFNGFMIQAFVDQTDYWVLSIAICTYFMLNDRKGVAGWLQSHRLIVWALPWFLSFLWATLGLLIAGYGDIGAWCWFTSDKVRLLVNFLPRWIIIAVMLSLYARLHFVIYRAHSNLASFDDPSTSNSSRSWPKSPIMLRKPSLPLDTQLDNLSRSSDQEHIFPAPRPVPRAAPARPKGSADLKRLSYQMMLYPLVYMLVWTLPTSIRIYQAVTGVSAPFRVATADKACIVVQGLLDAIVYGANEKTLQGWKEIFRRKKDN